MAITGSDLSAALASGDAKDRGRQRPETDHRAQKALRQAIDARGRAEGLQIELPPPPRIAFDPTLFDDPSIPPAWESFRVEGLKQHLWRYSGQISPRNAIARLEDPVWRSAWDAALATTAGLRLLFRGSELGVLALRALHHGAAHAQCLEVFALDARIAAGMVQKHFLVPWHARHGAAIQGWSAEERRVSFEAFARHIDIAVGGSQQLSESACDCIVFPQIDHTLLGTGIVSAIRQYRAGKRPAPRVLPAKATVFAMGVQWLYPGTSLRLDPINRLRWSLSPQAFDLAPELWAPLTAPVQVGTIDFADFSEQRWQVAFPVTRPGRIDAIVFWFELDLGNARISNAPGSELRCIRPAVQYTDGIEVQPGSAVSACVRVEAGRLYFQTEPPPALHRAGGVPGWYPPMLGDRRRNDAYRGAITSALAVRPAECVLDIGAGCGLLSMMAAQAGAKRVVGCEADAAIARAGEEAAALNRLSEVITLVHKDCRQMKVPDDLPQRADLAVFELFDASLIGEGILHFLAYAREHLLTQEARYLPAAGRVRAMLIEYRLDRIWDIDAKLLNPYRASPSFINVDASKLAYRALTEPFDVFAFDFACAGPAPQEKALHLPATAAGMAGAVLFWFDLRLDDTGWISNAPAGDKALHWKQGLQVLPEVRVERGQSLPLGARHNGSSLTFHWQRDVLPAEAFSKVPPLDPRWLAASGELERSTQRLLQHCALDPGEYAKVAAIAQRLAIDPATHGVDPTIAQRFATMFLKT